MFQYPTNKVPSEKRPIQFKAVDRNVPMHKIGFCSVLSNFPKKETFDLKTKKKTTVSFAERAKNNRKSTHSHGRKNHEKWLENHCSFDLTIKKSQSNWQQHSVLTEAQTNIKTVRRKSKHEKNAEIKKPIATATESIEAANVNRMHDHVSALAV